MSETGPWMFQIVNVIFASHGSTYSLVYFECGYLDCPFLGMNSLIKYVLRRYYLYSSSRMTHQCISFKIALKYFKNNLRRPFENFECIPLLYRYYMITIESI